MPDREKVIKAIKCRRSAHKRCGNPCERTGGCAYAAWIRDLDGEPYYPCYCDVERLCDDALALLREQEPQEPHYCEADDSWICGNCGETVGYDEFNPGGIDPVRNKYCPECGRKVKW